MSEYVFLFRSNLEDRKEHMGTPELAQKSMQAWLAWMRDMETKGKIKNPGQPLAPEGSVVHGKTHVVTDGPFIEVKDLVLGFIIVETKDLAEAVELAKGCPILQGEGSVEVRPVAKM
jgi:hypothetical protein